MRQCIMLVFLFLLSRWLAVPVMAQQPSPITSDTVYIYEPPRGYSGWTGCRDGQIEEWVRDPRYSGLMPDPLQSSLEWEGIQAHERTHVEQYHRYPTCEAAALAWRTNLADSTLALEAEAYCAQAQVFLKANAFSAGELRGRIIWRLLGRVPGKTVSDVLTVLERTCPTLH